MWYIHQHGCTTLCEEERSTGVQASAMASSDLDMEIEINFLGNFYILGYI